MPVKKEREYRTLVTPLTAQVASDKRINTECYVDIKDLATEIAAGLTEYDQNVADEIKTIVDDVAQEGVDELKQSSPKLTGSYRRGWRKKQTYADTRTKRNTVFNKTDYQLTHLLEYGHASRNGGRVNPRVHIKPVEEKMVTELQERIEKVVQQ